MKKKISIILFIYITQSCSLSDSPKTINLSEDWRFSPDGQNIGLAEKWHMPQFDDSKWEILDAGKRWEDQGFVDVDSLAWYRKTIDIPSKWKSEYVWLILGGVNDAYTLFVNGNKINAFGDQKAMTMAFSASITEVGQYLNFGSSNLIAIQVNDWGSSGGLWHLPAKLSIDKSEIEDLGIVSCFTNYGKSELWVNNNLSCLGKTHKADKLEINVRSEPNAPPIATHKLSLTDHDKTILAKIPMPDVQKNTIYYLTSDIANQQDEILLSLTKKVRWNPLPSRPDENGVKQLNNFVDELLNIKISGSKKEGLKFYNPGDGWVFISFNSNSTNSQSQKAYLDENSTPLVFRSNPRSGEYEAMQFLPKGEHTLNLKDGFDGQVIVRSIPEIIFSDHPSSPHIKPYGVYDWNYLTEHVLSNVNTIVTSANSLAETELEQWVEEGRHWIVHSSLPGLGKKQPAAPEDVYAVWSMSPGTTDPRFNGIIVDEFLAGAGADHYLSWTKALSSLYENPDFSNKVFYAYSNQIFYASNAPAIPFGKKLVGLGGRIALERYLPEQPTEAEAYSLLSDELTHAYKTIRKNLTGGVENLIITLGYLTDPTETLSRYPSVDYRVFMDMQFHLLATDPTFADLYGIQEYLSSYADEELLRWAHQLFRHYCIEGKRTRFTDDPYILTHLKNPDFAMGLEDWTVESAEEGSIQQKSMPGYSWLQGRYPRSTYGDHFVCFKRSSKKPNGIRQTVKDLDPGRLYSLKLIVADLNNLSKKQELGLSINLEQVEIIKDHSFRFIYPSNYSHILGPYNRDNPAWFNFYRIVFRPKGKTVALTISDWDDSIKPMGPLGQELICNFVEIQPFYEK